MNVVVTAVPYLVGHSYTLRQRIEYDEDVEREPSPQEAA
jgi:hypothetical protein